MVSVDFDDGFDTKVCLVDHIIIVVHINGVGYRGSSEMSQIQVQWSHFWRLLVSVDFDDSFNTLYNACIFAKNASVFLQK